MPVGLTIQAIDPDCALADLGLKAGDRILAIDDLAPRDVIDLQLELASARQLTIHRVGEAPVQFAAPKDGFDPGSIELAEAVPGGIRECNNPCEFCFIRGLPAALRP